MLDRERLMNIIEENGMNVSTISQKIGIDRTTFYRKMAKNSFNLNEIDRIVTILSLTPEEGTSIFFALKGA